MLDAAPHRGKRLSFHQLGCCVLATSSTEDEGESGLAVVGDLAVVYTGVVDNLPELAAELRPAGLRDDDDAGKLLIAGFRVFGEDLAGKLRGVFAVLLTDGHRLIGFHDQMGFRSLFYRLDGNGIYAASEAKQVVAGSRIPKEPDLEAVERIFFDADDDQHSTALRGVLRLPKASLFMSDGTRLRSRTYWDPNRLLEQARLSDNELHDRFDQLMTQAVARTLTGRDVVSLSGGIDSPAVAAFAASEHRRLTGRPIPAISIVYPGYPSADERRYVELICAYLQIPLHTYEQSARPLDDLTGWARLLDGPATLLSIPECAEHYRHIHDLGFRTILTGHHAEAVFDERAYLLAYLLARGNFSVLWRHLKGQRSMGRSYRAIGRQLAGPFVPRRLARTYRRLKPMDRVAGVPQWLDARKLRGPVTRFDATVRKRWAGEQLSTWTRPEMWLEADEICQARCGVIVRRPWADVDLWEFFLSLPAAVKFGDVQRKGLVRRLLYGKLPSEVLERTDKTVFDEVGMAQLDYVGLRHWLSTPRHRLSGVNYRILAEHLQREDLRLADLRWVTDLASVQAFLAQW